MTPPNTALQRTRSAPLRSLLSFETFGDSMVTRVFTLLGRLLLVGCFQPKRVPCSYLIPEGYVGWVRIDFLVPGGDPIPMADEQYILRFPTDGRISTSSRYETGWARDHYYYYLGGKQTELKATGWGEGGMIWGGLYGGSGAVAPSYQFFFVGTEKQYNDYVNSPDRTDSSRSGADHLPKTGSLAPLTVA